MRQVARLAQPRDGRSATHVEGREERYVLRQPSPDRRARRQHDHRERDPWLPPELARAPRREAHLHVEPAEQGLKIPEDGLDLDDQQDSAQRVIGKQVDSAALTVAIEALPRPGPTTPGAPTSTSIGPGERVTGVDQRPGISHAAAERDDDPSSERIGNVAHHVELEAPHPPGLEIDDCRSRAACTRAQVCLAPAAPMSQHPNGSPDFLVAHDRLSIAQRCLSAAYRRNRFAL